MGICDLCHNPAPFKKKNGEAYLEEHHVITLADGGPDAIYNTVALCPNCHKKVHVLNHKDDVSNLKRTIFNYLKNDNDEKNLKFFSNLFTEYQKINN
ncbi:MAG: HNH endonuclease [Bacilli bacterium]